MPFRCSETTRAAALDLVEHGLAPAAVARCLDIDTGTVHAWLHADAPHLVGPAATRCWRCRELETPPDLSSYAHLLGLSLGDGWIGRMRKGTYVLSVFCDDAWPGLAAERDAGMQRVLARRVSHVKRKGCLEVKAYSKHWPCLFPQLGAAGRVLRGLFHSDGWRGQNVAVKRVGDTVLRYRYPRYEFCSRSDDIRSICTGALDRLAIDWRRNGPFRISVARGRRSRRSMSTWAPKH